MLKLILKQKMIPDFFDLYDACQKIQTPSKGKNVTEIL